MRLVARQLLQTTLLAAVISQAADLGVVSMSASVTDVSVDMLQHVLQYYI